MAKAKWLKFRGRSAYAMVYKPDDFKGDRFWKISLYPDAETLQDMKDAGIQSRVKDDDGSKSGVAGKYMTFRLDTEKEFAGSGLTKFHPPIIKDKKGDNIVSYIDNGDGTFDRRGEPVLIGNGSDVEITLEVYPTKRFGNGSRLREVRIIDLIEYNPPEDVTENEVDSEPEEKVVEQNVSKQNKVTKSSAKVAW